MPFISYAQNFEDVMLWRALRHVEAGFYIDVGAMDPIIDSVTKSFYERGWHGINIEPVKQWFDKLTADRPRDLNLQTAIGAEGGTVHFYEVADTGLSTTSEQWAERCRQQGYVVSDYDVPCQTLTSICESNAVTDVHFLKVDVEGAETSVLIGLDLTRIRPWILVIESVASGSMEEIQKNWEPRLLEQGYRFAYFDGLNRYYIAKEHEDLLTTFCPPAPPLV